MTIEAAEIKALNDYEEYTAAAEAADWQSEIKYNQAGTPKTGAANAALIISHDSKFADHLRYNDFTGNIETVGAIDTKNFHRDAHDGIADGSLIGDIKTAVDDAFDVTFSTELITAGTLHAAKQHRYNPLLDRLADAHATWIAAGAKPQLENIFIDCLGAADTPATRTMTRLFFDGLVTRAHEPGCKFDYMTILFSQKQGIGKTWLLQKLGGEWYTDSLLDMKSKDSMQAVAQRWLVNDDELSVITDHRTNSFAVVKSFITRQTDEFRPPYTAHWESFPRRFALAGTTNEQSILKDATGSRRFNIITCGVNEITTGVETLDARAIDLYLGEAEDRYQRGDCKLVAEPDEQTAINEAKANFETVDEVEEALNTVLEALFPDKWWDTARAKQITYVANLLNGSDNAAPGVAQLDRVYIRWLLDMLFKLGPDKVGTPQYKRVDAKVRQLMDANPGWEKARAPIGFAKKQARQRGYRRR